MATMTRVRTIFTGVVGTPWYSNLYFAGDGDDQAYTEIVGDFWADCAAQMYNQITWATEAAVTHMDTVTGQPTGVGSVTPRSGSGASGGQPLPYSTQLLITMSTGVYRNGREVKGKIFVPGLTIGAVGSGQFLSAAVAPIKQAADDLRTAPVIADDFWLVYSPTAKAAYPVTGEVAHQKPAVLRSRRD